MNVSMHLHKLDGVKVESKSLPSGVYTVEIVNQQGEIVLFVDNLEEMKKLSDQIAAKVQEKMAEQDATHYEVVND